MIIYSDNYQNHQILFVCFKTKHKPPGSWLDIQPASQLHSFIRLCILISLKNIINFFFLAGPGLLCRWLATAAVTGPPVRDTSRTATWRVEPWHRDTTLMALGFRLHFHANFIIFFSFCGIFVREWVPSTRWPDLQRIRDLIALIIYSNYDPPRLV